MRTRILSMFSRLPGSSAEAPGRSPWSSSPWSSLPWWSSPWWSSPPWSSTGASSSDCTWHDQKLKGLNKHVKLTKSCWFLSHALSFLMKVSLLFLLLRNLLMKVSMMVLKVSWSTSTPLPLVMRLKPRRTSFLMMASREDQPQEGRDNTSSRDTIFNQNTYESNMEAE